MLIKCVQGVGTKKLRRSGSSEADIRQPQPIGTAPTKRGPGSESRTSGFFTPTSRTSIARSGTFSSWLELTKRGPGSESRTSGIGRP